MNVFITGTDTNVGKTLITAGIAGAAASFGYTAGVYKPVQTGIEMFNGRIINSDLDFVNFVDQKIITKCGYNFSLPAAPALAAEIEKIKIETEIFIKDFEELNKKCDVVIVEGAGGFLVPVYEDFLIRDLVKLLNIPLIIVARPDLGTINHTLLTIEAAKNSGINILGIIISNYPKDTDDIVIKTAPEIINKLSKIEILGIVPNLSKAIIEGPQYFIKEIIKNVDMSKIFPNSN